MRLFHSRAVGKWGYLTRWVQIIYVSDPRKMNVLSGTVIYHKGFTVKGSRSQSVNQLNVPHARTFSPSIRFIHSVLSWTPVSSFQSYIIFSPSCPGLPYLHLFTLIVLPVPCDSFITSCSTPVSLTDCLFVVVQLSSLVTAFCFTTIVLILTLPLSSPSNPVSFMPSFGLSPASLNFFWMPSDIPADLLVQFLVPTQ